MDDWNWASAPAMLGRGGICRVTADEQSGRGEQVAQVLLDVVLEGPIRLKRTNSAERGPVLLSQVVKESLKLRQADRSRSAAGLARPSRLRQAVLARSRRRRRCRPVRACLRVVSKKPSTVGAHELQVDARNGLVDTIEQGVERVVDLLDLLHLHGEDGVDLLAQEVLQRIGLQDFRSGNAADNAHGWPHLLLQSAQASATATAVSRNCG